MASDILGSSTDKVTKEIEIFKKNNSKKLLLIYTSKLLQTSAL